METKFEFKESDIEKIITLERDETLYLCDLEFSFGVLSKGKLILAYENSSGTGAALKLFSKLGAVLGGYVFFLEEEAIDNFYFIALEKTEILKVSNKRSRELLEDKDFLFLLLENITKSSFSLIKDLIYRSDKSVEKFLAYVLLKYSEDGQFKVRKFSLFSNYMKCSRSNLYIALGKLIERGIVKKEGKTITIIDWEGLKEASEI
jgi:CRP-like cAMP-binding protein